MVVQHTVHADIQELEIEASTAQPWAIIIVRATVLQDPVQVLYIYSTDTVARTGAILIWRIKKLKMVIFDR